MESIDSNSLVLTLNQLAKSINQMQHNMESAAQTEALSVIPPPPPLPATNSSPAIRKSSSSKSVLKSVSAKKQVRSEETISSSVFLDSSPATATTKTKETMNLSQQATVVSLMTNLLAQFSEHKQHVNIELAKINQKIDKYFSEQKEQTLAVIQPLLRPEINDVTKSRVQRVALEILKDEKTPSSSAISEALHLNLSLKDELENVGFKEAAIKAAQNFIKGKKGNWTTNIRKSFDEKHPDAVSRLERSAILKKMKQSEWKNLSHRIFGREPTDSDSFLAGYAC